MSVITYTKDGVADIKTLVMSIVKDLAGEGTPVIGDAAEHMKIVFPVGFDLTQAPEDLEENTLIILESTTAIDPFARADETVDDPTKDPWRLAFHFSKWQARPTAAKVQSDWQMFEDVKKDNFSLAVYVGTPSTLKANAEDDTKADIGWVTTDRQRFPFVTGYPDAIYDGYLDLTNPTSPISPYGGLVPVTDWRYRANYKNRDLVEPTGNTGAQWTNTFDPTISSIKFQQPQSPAPTTTAPTAPVDGSSTFADGKISGYGNSTKWDGPDVTDADQLFINRWVTAAPKGAFGGFSADSAYAQPISYRLVLSDHGLFLGCWGPDPEENGQGFSWVLVQRPVDKRTGVVRDLPADAADPGNRPLFCVNSVNGKFWKFVVREHDNSVPSVRKDATKNAPDSGAVINPYQQQSLTENGEYVITFLNNLNSSRFKYSDELDMVGTVSSDVVGGGSEIQVNVYGEKDSNDALSPRSYHALWSSGSFGTKMRIMIVKDIPDPNVPV